MSLVNQGFLTQKFLPQQELETKSTFFNVTLLCNVSSMMTIFGKKITISFLFSGKIVLT